MNSLQLDIFGGAMPAPPMDRGSDPITSHLAAASAADLQQRHHDLIVRCLKSHGALGKDGIAARTRLDGVAVCRRLVELQRLGRARLTGRCVQSTAGRAEREWEAV